MIGVIAVLAFLLLDAAVVCGALLWLSQRRLSRHASTRRALPGWGD